MTLGFPSELAWVGYLIGVEWPEADEDSLRRIATAWREAGDDVKALAPDLESAAREVRKDMQGQTTEALDQLFRDLLSGDLAPDKIAQAANKAADMSESSATDVEFTKAAFYATLAITALQILLAWAEAVQTFGGSLLTIPIIEAIGRFAVQMGLEQLLDRITSNVAGEILLAAVKAAATNAVLAAAQNAGLQGVQIAAGGRKEFDFDGFVKDVSSGAIGGAAGGGAGEAVEHGLGKLAGQRVPEISHFGTRVGLTAVAGAAGGATGSTASGVYAHEEYGDKFDPRNVLGGAVTGALSAGGRTAEEPKTPSNTPVDGGTQAGQHDSTAPGPAESASPSSSGDQVATGSAGDHPAAPAGPSQPDQVPDSPAPPPQSPEDLGAAPDHPSPAPAPDTSQPGGDAPTGGHDQPNLRPDAPPPDASTRDTPGTPAPDNVAEPQANSAPNSAEPAPVHHDPGSTTPQSAGQSAPPPHTPAATAPMSAGQPVHSPAGPGVPAVTSVHSAPAVDGAAPANGAPAPTNNATAPVSNTPAPANNPQAPAGNAPAPVGNAPTPAHNAPPAQQPQPTTHTPRTDTLAGDPARPPARTSETDQRPAPRTDTPRPETPRGDHPARAESSARHDAPSARDGETVRGKPGAEQPAPRSRDHVSSHPGDAESPAAHRLVPPTVDQTDVHPRPDPSTTESTTNDGAAPRPDYTEPSIVDPSVTDRPAVDTPADPHADGNVSSARESQETTQSDDVVDVNNAGGKQNTSSSDLADPDRAGTIEAGGEQPPAPDTAVGGHVDDPVTVTSDEARTDVGERMADGRDGAVPDAAAALLVLGADTAHTVPAGGREVTQTRARLDAARATSHAGRERSADAGDQQDGEAAHSNGPAGDQHSTSEPPRAGDDVHADAELPDVSTEQVATDHLVDDPAHHSGTDALATVDEHFDRSTDGEAGQRYSDDLGLTGRELEKLGGGELKLTDPGALRQQLSELGAGSAAVVVVEHPPSGRSDGDEYATGAHAFAVVNRDGEIVRVDGPLSARAETPLTDDLGGPSRAMAFDPNGNPLDPLGALSR